MTHRRLVNRNGLTGDYEGGREPYPAKTTRDIIAGDMRRVEQDSRDDRHLAAYAAHAGITPTQVRAVFDLFFDGDVTCTPGWEPRLPLVMEDDDATEDV